MAAHELDAWRARFALALDDRDPGKLRAELEIAVRSYDIVLLPGAGSAEFYRKGCASPVPAFTLFIDDDVQEAISIPSSAAP
jgi:hypothetical protein